MIAAHARGIVTSAAHRGEQVTYVPRTGDPITLQAVVIRGPVEPAASSVGRVVRRNALVVVPAGEGGIGQVLDGDRVEIAWPGSETAVSLRVLRIRLRTGGSFHLEVQT